jgi:phage terminase large subunit-like protein
MRGNSQMDEKRVKIKYRPREQFRSFHNRKQRWSVLVCHRRAGKTVATLNDLIRGAVNECKPEGRYAFIFPQRNQAKDTAWRYLRRYAEPLLGKPPNESELRVDLVNGAMIRLYGADNPDALRGPYLDGVVLDEFADMKPEDSSVAQPLKIMKTRAVLSRILYRPVRRRNGMISRSDVAEFLVRQIEGRTYVRKAPVLVY